jgi:hypothetical protein
VPCHSLHSADVIFLLFFHLAIFSDFSCLTLFFLCSYFVISVLRFSLLYISIYFFFLLPTQICRQFGYCCVAVATGTRAFLGLLVLVCVRKAV